MQGRDTADSNRSLGFFETLGMMAALSMESEYRHWSIADMEINFLPALRAGQCKIYLDEVQRPVAFVTWAFVDDECHAALYASGENPPPNRWTSGNHLWFIDIVAPFGNVPRIIRDLQRNHFPQHHAHSVKRSPDGSIERIKIWRNALVGLSEVAPTY